MRSLPPDNASHERYEAVTLQPGMLFSQRHQPHSGVDVLQVVVDWPAVLDPGAMRTAWRHAGDRHSVLRTAFDWPAGDQPTQAVHPSAVVPVAHHDWSAPGNPPELAAVLAADRAAGFDPGRAPLARVSLITHGPDRHTVAVTVHHAILDGRSLRLLLAEVFAEHDALAAGRPWQAPARPAYGDFARWVAERTDDGDPAFWQRRLGGTPVPTRLAPLTPPGAAPPRTAGSVREAALELSGAATAALRATGFPADTLVTAAWALALGHHTRAAGVVFGSVRSCRGGTVDGADRMIGLLINTLPLRVDLPGDSTVRAWLGDVRRRTGELRGHRLTPLDRIQRWAGVPAGTPLFESVLMYDHHDLQGTLAATVPGWGRRRARVHRHPGPPLVLCVFGEPALHALLYHDRNRLSPYAADALLSLFGRLLEALPAHLDRPVAALLPPAVPTRASAAPAHADAPAAAPRRESEPAATNRARHAATAPGEADRTAASPIRAGGSRDRERESRDGDAGRTVGGLVAGRAREMPGAVAVTGPGGTLTYGELLDRADRLAGALRGAGVRSDDQVAVALPRSVELIVALLGVLRAGAAYLPLDPDDPPARTEELLRQAGSPATVARRTVPGAGQIVSPDATGTPPGTGAAHPAGLAYVCHTSGSTGVPKAVGVPHAAVVRLVAEPGYLRLGPGERVLQLAPVAFDAATLEIWGSLAAGATLVVAPPGPHGPAELGALLRRERISVLWLTAGLFHQVAELAPESLAGVGQLLAGGDVLDPAAVRRALRARGGAPLINGYGPTENTTFTTVHVMTDPDAVEEPVPIGRPVPGTTVHVLDAALRPVPDGEEGDLYAAGAGLARGYLGRPGATAAVFLPDPYAAVPGSRMYRTGDRARRRADGTLEFRGRADDQVKIRGFRVEPGEAAAVLRRHPGVAGAAVVVAGTGEGRRLVAYVAGRRGVPAPAPAELSAHAARYLPVASRPAAYAVVAELPLTPSGKLDRRALPPPPVGNDSSGEAPAGATEKRLAGLWRELLGVPGAGGADDFFALGGNSLLATRLTFAVADAFGVELPVRAVYDSSTLSALAAAVDALPTGAAPAGPVARDRTAYRLTPGAPDAPGAAGNGTRAAYPAGPDDRNAPAAADGHLAWPGAGPWAVWRWVGLRAAGFPLDTLTGLGDPALSAAADVQDRAEQRYAAARRALAHALHDARAAAPPGERTAWNRAARQAKRDGPPAALPDGAPGGVAEAHAAARAAHARVLLSAAAYGKAWDRAVDLRNEGLRRAAADPRFREAVTWQNRHARRTGVDAVARPGGSGSQHRQHQALVATYLQRYCAKNDTIGFFGPVGWARVTGTGAPVTVRHTGGGPAVRTVYFENWAVAAVAEALVAADARLLPWLVPRRMPYLRVEQDRLLLPLTPPVFLEPGTARLLAACDGTRTTREAAAAAGLAEEEAHRVLGELRDARRISWSFEVPKEDLFPERALRARLTAVGDAAARDGALAALDRLETARDGVARAAGDPDRLDDALARLEETFTGLTGTAATRRAGKVYAGRTVVYEDCRSGTEVTLSQDLLGTLWPALSLLLESARWFTYAGSALFRRACADRYRELAGRGGSAAVPFADFWLWANDVLFDAPERLIAPVVRGLQDRWAAILPAAADGRITATSAGLRESVLRAFAAPRPGWAGAQQHSPDVMLAADGPDAVARGDFHWVVGEVHPGVNTLRSALFVAQHPDPGALRAAMAADLPRGRIVLAATGEEGGAPARITDQLVTARDLRLVFGHDSGGLDPAAALPVADCIVHDAAGVLTVSSRDGRHRMPLADVIGEPVMLQLLQRFDVLRPAAHRPRLTVDRVLWSREGWSFPAADLGFARTADEGERFRQARRWQREHRLPRHTFVSTPVEKKPFHLDLTSLASIDVLARAVRRTAAAGPAAALRLSEMVPGPGQTWLTGADGRPRTAELRLVAVDTRKEPTS